MKRVLVLGGGGVVGVAWESGVCAGMLERGVDLTDCNLVLGTSAGAIVGACLLSGKPLVPELAAHSAGDIMADIARVDPQAMGQIFNLWRELAAPESQALRSIGAIARQSSVDREPELLARMSTLGVERWPQHPLRIFAVDTLTGERRCFDRDSGVPITRAIAASAAVPGMFPPITIGGARYMDGQVHSPTHLDTLLGERPRQVLVLLPTTGRTARAIGRQAERALSTERALIEAQGGEVVVCMPREADAEALGRNLMDPGRVGPAYEAGLAQAQALAAGLHWD